jgi:hypothetical protein
MEIEKQTIEQAIIREEAVKPSAPAKRKADEMITVTAEDIEVYLKRGKGLFMAGRFQEALDGFEAILRFAPAHIETRIWTKKAKDALANPDIEEVTKEINTKYCVWTKMGLVENRTCTFDYDCLACEFDIDVRVRMATGDPKVLDVLENQADLPGNKKLCRYAMKQEVSYRLCSRMFHCETCEFSQNMERISEQKLDARQQAVEKKSKEWWWPYWGNKAPTTPKQKAEIR